MKIELPFWQWDDKKYNQLDYKLEQKISTKDTNIQRVNDHTFSLKIMNFVALIHDKKTNNLSSISVLYLKNRIPMF